MRSLTIRIACVTAAVVVLSIGIFAMSQGTAPSTSPSAHVMAMPGDMKWGAGPASLPAGTMAAVLEGDPTKAGLFTMRLKLPANYKVPPHWHPADEHITVVSGAFYMGMGDKLDESKATGLPAGSFALMPTKTNHFAFTKVETVVQLHGMGPWGINYVNPADDPRKK